MDLLQARPVPISPANPLVLGSASPRRRELIASLGVPFVVRAVCVDESMRRQEGPDGYLVRVVLAKLEAVRAVDLGSVAGVLVADTVVLTPPGVGGRLSPDRAVLGKPRDAAEARAMIERLAGATHEVCTRFVLATRDVGAPPLHAQTVTTRVTFRAISREEAARYAAAGEGRDKAGGYAVQGEAAAFVERIEGSYTNVVGLPLDEVARAMRGLGWLV